MFACILNINPVKLLLYGDISPSVVFLTLGPGAISRKWLRNAVTPKSARAVPKNTGVRLPSLMSLRLNSFPAPFISSMLSLSSLRLSGCSNPSSSGPNTPSSPSFIISFFLYR